LGAPPQPAIVFVANGVICFLYRTLLTSKSLWSFSSQSFFFLRNVAPRPPSHFIERDPRINWRTFLIWYAVPPGFTGMGPCLNSSLPFFESFPCRGRIYCDSPPGTIGLESTKLLKSIAPFFSFSPCQPPLMIHLCSPLLPALQRSRNGGPVTALFSSHFFRLETVRFFLAPFSA